MRVVVWIRCTVLTKDPAFTLRMDLRFGGTLKRRKNVVPGTVSHRKEGDLSDESWLSHFQIKKSNRLCTRRLLPLVRGAFNNAPLVDQMAFVTLQQGTVEFSISTINV